MIEFQCAVQLPPAVGPERAAVAQEGMAIWLALGEVAQVVLPALVLTFVIDYFGVRIAPDLYLDRPWFGGDMLPLRYLASLFLVHDFWSLGLAPGINQPFWSLSFEALYYVVFGIAFFARSRWKWLAIAVALLLSGPIIAALLPVWLLGFYCYRLTKHRQLPFGLAALAFIVGLALLALAPTIRASKLPPKLHTVSEL